MLKKFANIACSWAFFMEILCPTPKLNPDAKGAHL
jgi:hypothetical protein